MKNDTPSAQDGIIGAAFVANLIAIACIAMAAIYHGVRWLLFS
jgi:hypothetical protein